MRNDTSHQQHTVDRSFVAQQYHPGIGAYEQAGQVWEDDQCQEIAVAAPRGLG